MSIENITREEFELYKQVQDTERIVDKTERLVDNMQTDLFNWCMMAVFYVGGAGTCGALAAYNYNSNRPLSAAFALATLVSGLGVYVSLKKLPKIGELIDTSKAIIGKSEAELSQLEEQMNSLAKQD